MNWNQLGILVVEDEKDLMELLTSRFERKGAKVIGVSSSEAALQALTKESFDIGIYDINLPGMDGIELLRKTKEANPTMEVVMLTGHGTVETAIEAMKLGAYDYLRKPYALSELEVIMTKALEKKHLIEANQGLKQALLSDKNLFEIIGESKELRSVLELTKKVAGSDLPVLIEGESGTGKELIAKALHFWGERAGQPFIAVNSGALPENLLESELFGHAKGAFTGAAAEKKGLVEVADQGTLFLDEIGEMPSSLQVKLLRFLENQEFRRVGDSRLRKVNVRVVAATNRVLEEEVAKGNFREDLYYRLNVIKLTLPPLRDRKSDIPLLVEHFLQKFGRGSKVSISEGAMKKLLGYSYPGNIRELSHMLERGLLLAKDYTIAESDLFLPKAVSVAAAAVIDTSSIPLAEMEKQHILRVMESVQGNKTQAAQLLGISVRNLYRKLEEYNS